MDSNMVLQSNYLDLIFDGRNKQYGSYALRTTYPQRMRRAGGFILCFALLFVAYSIYANRAKPLPVMPLIEKPVIVSIVNPKLDIPKKVFIPPAPPAGNPSTNTLKITPPDIVVDDIVKPENKMATQEDLKIAVPGKNDFAGAGIGNESLDFPEGRPGGGGGGETEGGGGSKKITAEIPTFVQQMPEFPGGEAALSKYLSENIRYPQSASNANQQGKVQVKFVVNEDGSISNVVTTRGFGFGSEDESIRVVSGMPRWKPGRNNGKAVKVWFQLPVIFRLN